MKTVLEEECEEDDASDAGDSVPNIQEVEVDQAADVAQTLECLSVEAAITESIISHSADEQVQNAEAKLPIATMSSQAAEQVLAMEKPRPGTLTLQQILSKNGFDKYAPGTGDTEDCMLLRLRRMLPDMLQVVTAARLGEGFLRASQIEAPKKPLSAWNQLQKDLSEAQRSFALKGVRQGRAASWWGFAGLVAEAAQKEAIKHSGLPASDIVLRAPSEFRPSNVLKDAAGVDRGYQVLVVRLHHLGQNRLALVERVFRGSTGRKGKPHESTLPSQQTTCLHLVLFSSVEDSKDLFRCSCVSPAITVDPHEDKPEQPRILLEVTREHTPKSVALNHTVNHKP